ncbi:Hypothetical protein D9617_7g030050 [Elsinoe fawcettii]|nr:Hypothetical protein D9617_7g030050 [Elsinoe fawcettii]
MSAQDNREATLQAYLKAFQTYDAKAMIATFSDDVVQRILPGSLGLPPRDKTEIERALPSIEKAISNHKLEIRGIIRDFSQNRACVYVLSTADTPVGPWNNESVCFFQFNDAGDKIVNINEFMDAVFMQQYMAKFAPWAKENGY